MLAGPDLENGIPEDKQKEAKPGAAVVETEHGTQEVDFKTLTAEEAFEVLGVCPLPGGANGCLPAVQL